MDRSLLRDEIRRRLEFPHERDNHAAQVGHRRGDRDNNGGATTIACGEPTHHHRERPSADGAFRPELHNRQRVVC